jgi:hypothetical protein
MAIKNTRKVVSKTTTKKSVVTTTTKKPAAPSDLKPGERRVNYEPSTGEVKRSFYDQKVDPRNIVPLEPSDTTSIGMSQPGYRIDMSRSHKNKSTGAYQAYYIKLAPNKKKPTTPTPSKETKSTTPKREEMDPSARLPIRKAKTIETTYKNEIVRSPKPTLKVPVEVKYKKEPKVKAMSKGGKPLQRLAKNVKATANNIVGPSKFKREEKLAGAFERTGKAVSTKGNSAKQNVKDIKEFKKFVKSEEGQKRYGKEAAKSLKKDLNQSKRYIKREEKGKNKYFNQEALNKTQDMSLAEIKRSKGKTQAGKRRFS